MEVSTHSATLTALKAVLDKLGIAHKLSIISKNSLAVDLITKETSAQSQISIEGSLSKQDYTAWNEALQEIDCGDILCSVVCKPQVGDLFEPISGADLIPKPNEVAGPDEGTV